MNKSAVVIFPLFSASSMVSNAERVHFFLARLKIKCVRELRKSSRHRFNRLRTERNGIAKQFGL